MGEKLREINFDVLAEMRAEGEGMFGIPQPLPIPHFEKVLRITERDRATLEGMPEPTREIEMQTGIVTKLS